MNFALSPKKSELPMAYVYVEVDAWSDSLTPFWPRYRFLCIKFVIYLLIASFFNSLSFNLKRCILLVPLQYNWCTNITYFIVTQVLFLKRGLLVNKLFNNFPTSLNLIPTQIKFHYGWTLFKTFDEGMYSIYSNPVTTKWKVEKTLLGLELFRNIT